MAARGVPASLVRPTLPLHLTTVGRTGAPPARTRTDAVIGEPALGFVGERFTRLALTAVPVPPVGSATTTVIVAVLLLASGSVVDAVTIVARSV